MIPGTCGKNYVYAGFGQTCLDANAEIIEDLSECKTAANEMGRNFTMTTNEANFPTGCYVYWDSSNNNISQAYFNTNSTDTRNDAGNPICKRGIEGI